MTWTLVFGEIGDVDFARSGAALVLEFVALGLEALNGFVSAAYERVSHGGHGGHGGECERNPRYMRGFRTEDTENTERNVNEIRSIIVEIHSVEQLARVHKKQVLNYLKLTGLKLGLLINFGGEPLKGNIERLVVGPIPDIKSPPCPP